MTGMGYVQATTVRTSSTARVATLTREISLLALRVTGSWRRGYSVTLQDACSSLAVFPGCLEPYPG